MSAEALFFFAKAREKEKRLHKLMKEIPHHGAHVHIHIHMGLCSSLGNAPQLSTHTIWFSL